MLATCGPYCQTKCSVLKCLLLFTTFILCAAHVQGQGCSDAGFCTVNSLKPQDPGKPSAMNSQFKLGTFYGIADNDINVYGTYLEYNRNLGARFGFDAKLTTLAQNGNGISVFGPGDIFLNARHQFTDDLNLTLGAKIPLSRADKTHRGLPLPMDYQSSLGTLDLILGLGYAINKLQLAVAWQQPLTQNENRFLAGAYPVNSKLRSFQSTNQFNRSGDVLLRISYPLSTDSRLRMTPSLLPIYHLRNDRYQDAPGREMEINGSQGLTLNGNLYFDYMLHNGHALQLSLGAPFIVRDSRPDGLTRSFVANLEYRVSF